MSSTFYVFARRGNSFAPLLSYGASSDLCRAFEDAINIPYEKVKKISCSDLELVERELRKTIEKDKAQIAKYDEMIAAISKMSDPIDEKIEKIHEYLGWQKEYAEGVADNEKLLAQIEFLDSVAYEMESMEKYCKIADLGLYIGIDSGYDITAEDIK